MTVATCKRNCQARNYKLVWVLWGGRGGGGLYKLLHAHIWLKEKPQVTFVCAMCMWNSTNVRSTATTNTGWRHPGSSCWSHKEFEWSESCLVWSKQCIRCPGGRGTNGKYHTVKMLPCLVKTVHQVSRWKRNKRWVPRWPLCSHAPSRGCLLFPQLWLQDRVMYSLPSLVLHHGSAILPSQKTSVQKYL